jgi:predicted Zn-dependent protease
MPPSPSPLALLAAAAGEAPPIRPRSRSSWAGRAFAGAAVTAALALLPYLRASRAEPRRGPESEAAGARRDAVVLGDGLAQRYRTDTALFQRYLRAEAALQAARYRPARDSFQAIVGDAPLYAPAWAGLSTALSLSGFDEMPPNDALPLSLAAARRALALDSTLVHAKSSVIAYDLAARWDLPAAKRGLDAALARHPDEPQLNELLATWHRWRGELDEALELRRKVYRLNPLRPSYAQSVAGTLYMSHRCAESVEVLQRMMMDFPQTASATANLYKSYRCLDRTDEAAAALAAQLRLQGDTALAARLDPPMPAARRDSMLRTVVQAQLTRLLERRRRGWVPSRTIALKYAELRDADTTLAWMDSMYVERSMSLHTVPFDPLFDFLRGDARYRAFVAKLPWNPRLARIRTR